MMSGQAYINSGEFQDVLGFASIAAPNADWANPSNAQSSNDAYATALLTDVVTDSDRLACTELPRKIPDGATIQGIAVRWERRQDSGGSIATALFLTKDGAATVGTIKTEGGASVPTTDTYKIHGGATDLWGAAWTAAEINAPTFGVLITGSDTAATSAGHTLYVDHVQIAVYYS